MKNKWVTVATDEGLVHLTQCQHLPTLSLGNVKLLARGEMVPCMDCFCNIQADKNGLTIRRV